MQAVRGSIQFEKSEPNSPARRLLVRRFSHLLYGAVSDAQCPSPIRDCPGGSGGLVSVRFRPERTGARGVYPAVVGGRGGPSRRRTEPRHPDRTPESGDPGCRDRADARRVGALAAVQPQPDVDLYGAHQPVRGRPEQDHRLQVRNGAGRHAGPADRRRLQPDLEQLAALVEQLLPDLQPADAFEPRGRLHPAAAPELQDRQHPAAARDQPQGPRERRHDAPADDYTDRAKREERLLGPVLLDQQPERAAPVARSGQTAARRQREARADRHDGADRHRRGAVGSREARGVGDRGRSRDQVGRRSAARAHLRSRVA